METILAITLSDRQVTCLKLEVHAKTSVVADYFYASYGSDEELKTILPPVLKRFGRCDSCRVSLDAPYFYFRNISLPFSDIKKIEKVLVHELEDSTSYSCADMHYDFLNSPKADGTTEIIVALIEKQVVAELIAFFSECGADPDLITITELAVLEELIRREGHEQALMLVDVEAERLSLTVVKRGGLHLVRSIVLPGEQGGNGHGKTNEVIRSIRQVLLSTGGLSDQDELQRIFLKGSASHITELKQNLTEQFGMNTSIYVSAERQLLKIEPTDNQSWDPQIMDDALCLAHKGKGDVHNLNLRKSEFRKQKKFKDIKKLFLAGGIMAILLSLVFGVYGGYELNRLKNKQNELKTDIEAVFKETLPEVTRIVRPLEQLRVKVDEVKELYSVSRRGSDTMGMVNLLAEISSRIPPELQINLTRFVADGDSVRLRGETQDFKTVDSVQKSLEKSPAFKTVIISSANLATTGEGVRFEIKLDLNE